MYDREESARKELAGHIEGRAVLTGVLSIAKQRGIANRVALKLVEMMDLPGQFFIDNKRNTLDAWLEFALQYDHATDYGPIRLKYYEGDPSKLEMTRHKRRVLHD